jgi:hypothetical protein
MAEVDGRFSLGPGGEFSKTFKGKRSSANTVPFLHPNNRDINYYSLGGTGV